MADKTKNFGLNKPRYDERPDIEVLNQNFDIIDDTLQSLTEEMKTKADKDEFEEHTNDNERHITAVERITWNAKETPSGAQQKADKALQDAKIYADTRDAATLNDAKSYTDNKVANLVGSAPEALDTLYELAEALGNDPNFAATVMTEIGKKASKNEIPTKVSQLQNDKQYVTQEELGQAGYGDMLKSIYDTNNNGKVDVAENAEKLGGQEPSYYQKALGYTPENVDNKGKAGGYASLDSSGKVPTSQLPEMGVGSDHLTDFIPHGIMNASTTITYDSNGNVTQIDVKQGSTLKVRTTLSYSGDRLTTINVKKYAPNGSTVEREYTDTLVYSGEDVVGINRVVNV